MTRPIDADELRELYNEHNFDTYNDYNFTIDTLDDMLTINVVEVVRCKDCKWGKEVCGNIECWTDTNLPPEYHGYYWYCPNGERKEE